MSSSQSAAALPCLTQRVEHFDVFQVLYASSFILSVCVKNIYPLLYYRDCISFLIVLLSESSRKIATDIYA